MPREWDPAAGSFLTDSRHDGSGSRSASSASLSGAAVGVDLVVHTAMLHVDVFRVRSASVTTALVVSAGRLHGLAYGCPVEWARGIAPRASRRTGREPLSSSGSHQANTPVIPICQCTKRSLRSAASRCKNSLVRILWSLKRLNLRIAHATSI